MRVLDHKPYAWFLLEHEDGLYLDAYCSFSFLDYSVLVALNANEIERYRDQGRRYLDQLAQAIHNSAPGARVSTSPFKSRDLTKTLGELVTPAVQAWRAEQTDIGQSGSEPEPKSEI